ncbi:hypothetical protein FQA39_LY01099 [Lamprigera yunnana]|nr:hypothetical protein FQA39_LY01099 [Lamprigera yunnana]
MSNTEKTTIDENESSFFNSLCNNWWNENELMIALHNVNQKILPFMCDQIISTGIVKSGTGEGSLEGLHILEVGCGGGFLSEGLARTGCKLIAIDISAELIEVAKQHALSDPTLPQIAYSQETIEDHCKNNHQKYDVVIANFVLEHVSDHDYFVKCCADCVKPGGSLLLSAMAQTFWSWMIMIVLYESIFRAAPKGCHDYYKCINSTTTEELIKSQNGIRRDTYMRCVRKQRNPCCSSTKHHRQMLFLWKVFEADDNHGSSFENENEESGEEITTEGNGIAMIENKNSLCKPHLPKRESCIKEETTINEIEETTERKDRYLCFFNSILPSLSLIDDDEALEFQARVINLLHDMKQQKNIPQSNYQESGSTQPQPQTSDYFSQSPAPGSPAEGLFSLSGASLVIKMNLNVIGWGLLIAIITSLCTETEGIACNGLCNSVKCERVDGCAPGETLKLSGYCNCCKKCIKLLKENEQCGSLGEMVFMGYPSNFRECDEGLICIHGVCQQFTNYYIH